MKIELRTGPFGFGSALIVSGGNGQWTISTTTGVFKPKPVLDAWHQAANGPVNTG